MNKFLLAKHWQLFTLTFGIPIIFDILLFSTAFSKMADGDPTAFFNGFKFFPLIMLICMGTVFGWQWAIGINLQHKIPQGVKMKTILFKTFITIPLVYISLIICYLSFIMRLLPGDLGQYDNVYITPFLVIIPIHLFSMFCIFYCMYFAAKTLKSVEMQKEATFSDFAGEFFLIWFFPIGIWIIQPRLNKLMESEQ